jgi:hypothetical protein
VTHFWCFGHYLRVEDLPPDLSRLGHDLTSAVSRSLRRQQWRRRLVNRVARVGASGALIFLAMTPGLLGPAIVAIDEWMRVPLPGNAALVSWDCDSPPHNPAPICSDMADQGVARAADHWTPARHSARAQPVIGP